MNAPEAQDTASDVNDSVAEPTLRRLCSELILMRERNDRQHRVFEQTLSQLRSDWQAQFSQYVSETQQAYQRLRDELGGEKRHSLALLNSLVDLTLELQKVANSDHSNRGSANSETSESVDVVARRAETMIARLGIHRYDAVVASAYVPALHERVGELKVEGMGPLLVARQIEPGYASQQPDFVLRRAKILVSE